MTTWKDSLSEATAERTLTRARSGLRLGTEYKLGEGGYNPMLPIGRRCDCSGFIAWAIGIPRELPPRHQIWLDTDAYWDGGGGARRAAGFPLFTPVERAEARPGDLIVYPDYRNARGQRRQGHMGVISHVGGAGGALVIHCSNGNWRDHREAIRETDTEIFDAMRATRIVRPDYAALRRYCGVAEPAPVVVEPVEPVEPEGEVVEVPRALRHSLLAGSATLARVLEGSLVIRRVDMAVSGVGTVQQALNVLARGDARYRVDLGPNDRNAGVFGPNTERSLKHLQAESGLEPTGVLDAATLLAIDAALLARADGDDTDTEEAEGRPLPDEAREPEPTPAAPAREIVFTLANENGRWFATADGGERFYVGRRTRFNDGGVTRRGLENYGQRDTPVYRPEHYAQFGHWAYLIKPTAAAESEGGRFDILNTYDSARFTFGFMQFAAHVPDRQDGTPAGDFVRFFAALLADDAERRAYFPDLELTAGGRIARHTSGGPMQLETAASTAELMRYLNPSDAEVEEREVLQAAKFVHWCRHSERHRNEQARWGVDIARRLVREAHRKGVPLDGRSDKVCLAVMDILHHGRAKYVTLAAIVRDHGDERAYDLLLQIGTSKRYIAERVATIRAQVRALEAEGKLGHRRYSAAVHDFVG